MITKKMTLGEIVNNYPELAKLLMEKGLPCVGCHIASQETLEQGAEAHGLNPDDLVKQMNKKLKKTKKKENNKGDNNDSESG